MRTRPLRKYGVVLLAAVLVAATAGVASSVTYTLRVGSDNVVMPDNAVIPVWKIADAGGDNVLRFPGPTLVGTVGDNLVITLVNGLRVDNTSTAGPGHGISLVIPGLAMPVVENPAGTPLPQQGPVFDNNTPRRVISFAQLTPADNGTRTYRFALTKPGTFLYESGADPSVQVGMGIYGAVIVRPANPAQAYPPTATNPNTTFVNEVVLLYGAIDPFLHHAVADNTYGTQAFPSSTDYEPKYFLLNGKPYQNQADPFLQHHTPVPVGPPGGVTLLRFLNASSIGLAPSFLGTYVDAHRGRRKPSSVSAGAPHADAAGRKDPGRPPRARRSGEEYSAHRPEGQRDEQRGLSRRAADHAGPAGRGRDGAGDDLHIVYPPGFRGDLAGAPHRHRG